LNDIIVLQVILLVGNKVDLKEDRKVSSQEAIALSEDFNLHYIETSAKTAQNVKIAFHSLVKKTYESHGSKFSSSPGGSSSIIAIDAKAISDDDAPEADPLHEGRSPSEDGRLGRDVAKKLGIVTVAKGSRSESVNFGQCGCR